MKTQIKNDMVQAMKDKNVIARDVLRVLMGEIQRSEQTAKNGKVEVTDEAITSMVKKLIDSIKESGEDNGEIAILEVYLPQQMTELNITETVVEYMAMHKLDSPKEMGKVMGYFKQNFAGTYDGKLLSGIVKNLLS
jgi:uncharacterized protein YqeY